MKDPMKKPGGIRGSAALTHVIVSSVLAVVVALLVSYLSLRHFERWDITSSARFAVSSRTRAVVRGLREDVTLYMFLSQSDQSYPEVRELLRKYESMSPKLHVRFVDPDRNPSQFRVLAQRFRIGVVAGEDGSASANVVAVAEAGDRTHKIGRDDLISLDFGSLESEEGPTVDVKTERALTSAIVGVTQGRDTKVCVTTGHGEWTREGQGPRSLATIGDDFLELDNITLVDLPLTPSATIPRDCDAVFVIGPQRVFDEAIATKLGAYVRAGGHLLVAVDPILRDDGTLLPTGLEGVLSGFGIDVGRDIVVERATDHQLGAGPIEVILEGDFQPHPITRALAAQQSMVALQLARSVGVRAGSSAKVLLRASGESYGEAQVASLQGGGALEPGEGDTPGPVGLVAAWSSSEDENDVRAGRVVVMGDTDVFQTEILAEPRFGNFDLLSGVTGWLTARPQMITIAPRRVRAQSFVGTAGDVVSVFVRVVLLVPFAFALLGFSVWWSRRA